VGDSRITVGRELTKAHEKLVFGPISEVVSRLSEPIGEFTVVIEIGETTEISLPAPPTADEIAAEFVQLTKNARLTRRRAITEVARRHRLRPNTVYEMVERGKKSVN
jgi:16S rRNA C1402 (ribose-2'-O) methylase RsmI